MSETYIPNIVSQSNPFLVDVPILYPLKTPENLLFFWYFQGL